MARIAYILLCHKDPKSIIHKARQLTDAGDFVAIHFDARAGQAAFDQMRDALALNENVIFAPRRVKCGWGEWSLVDATLVTLRAAEEAFPEATHFFLISGDCMPIKSARHAHEVLDRDSVDYIESFDFFDSDWIKTGIKQERLIYRHWVNERGRKWLFYASLELQKRLGLTRALPQGVQVMIGSQWWCLRRATVQAVLAFIDQRPDVPRFFRTTWIPDETFFQTLVAHVVPRAEIRRRTQTFGMFTDYGLPVNFHNDHYDLLLGQDYLFARKVSPEAHRLKDRLGHLYNSDRTEFAITNEGRNLFTFLTTRGRVGRRFGTRFWESEASVGPSRALLVISCKKWHVAKRLAAAIRRHANLPAVDYVFDEESCDMPDLGGIEARLGKRTRHRRALVKMLFDHYGSDRLVLCIDPARIELLDDFYSDNSATRLLEVHCGFTDDYLIGHARRVGLAGDSTPDEMLRGLLPTMRQDLAHENDRIRDRKFPGSYRLVEDAPLDKGIAALASFLDVSAEVAQKIACTDPLFAD